MGGSSGVAKVVELGGGQAGGKGLYQGGGKHICATRTAVDILAGILWATDGAQKVTHFGLL